MAKPVTRPVAIYATRTTNIPGADVDLDITTLEAAINDPATYNNYGVDTGAANAYAVTYSPAVTAYTAGLILQFKSANLNTGASTLNANALGAKSITNTDGSALVGGQIPANAIISVQYDGTAFQIQSPTPVTGSGISMVRQTVLIGAVDANGYANHLSAGAGLNFNVAATATPMVISYSSGFGGNGSIDFISRLSADATNQGSLAASNLNYINSTFLTSGSVTWGSTLAPPQYGYAYDRTKQSLLRFAGTDGSTTILDDYGNTWTASGNAQIDTAVQIDGLNTLLLDGTGDYVTSTNFTTLGGGGWAIEMKIRWNTLPTAGNSQIFCDATNASGFGATGYLNNTAGTIKLGFNASSNGSSNDIAVTQLGTSTTWATATTYHIAVVYDAVAGKYFFYKDGVVDLTVTTASRICGLTQIRVGANQAGAGGVNGAMAGFRFLPYCAYPNGTTFTAPTISTFTVNGATSSDFFSIPAMTMYGVTAASASAGTNPTLTAKNVMYHGEQTTNASAVVSTVNYAYKGQYVSQDVAWPASSTRQNFAHNIGHNLYDEPSVYARCITADSGFTTGMFVRASSTNGVYSQPMFGTTEDRNNTSIVCGSSGAAITNRSTGAFTAPTASNFKIFITVKRSF